MTARFGRETWSLQVPTEWRAWHDEECATLTGPDDIGALQISAAFKEFEVLDADLRDFASKHLDAGAKPKPAQFGDFLGFEIFFREGDSFWRHWYLRNRKQMLLVTYNCDLNCRGVEDVAICEALASLRANGHEFA